jgi:ParB/RepB/Spo0J family partition protein
MAGKEPKRTRDGAQEWPIANLKTHPRQLELFGEPSDQELQDLAESMKKGLDHPIEILPDGKILCGHRRTAAARLLGWPSIAAIVRHDLGADPVAAEARLIEENLYRRQMGPLQIARCWRRLKLLRGRGGNKLDGNRELSESLTPKLRLSRRQLDRYLRVLEHCPIEVQLAVDRNELGVTPALDVAGMSKDEKQTVVEAIRRGVAPSKAVKLPEASPKFRDMGVQDALWRLAKNLNRANTLLSAKFDQVDRVPDGVQKALEEGAMLIRRVQKIAKAQGK